MNQPRTLSTVVTQIISGDLWAGAEVQVYNLCKGLLASEGIRPTAVLFNEGLLSARLRELGMAVDIADEKQLSSLKIIQAISVHCQKHHSQVVHTHGFKENILGVIAKDLARVPRSIRTVHGNPENFFPLTQVHKRLIQQLDVMLGRLRQNHIVAVSTQLEERLKSLYPGKVEKIFNFIDVDTIRKKSLMTEKLRSEALKLGIIGRLVPVKRIDIFIETLALLNKQGVACTGVVIGAGPLEKTLKNHAIKLGIFDLLEFKGFVDPVHDELCQLDALLMTSDHEGLPMILLEALALEVPVIAHNTGGIPEILNHGASGWLVDNHSAEGYAQTVCHGVALANQVRKKTDAGLRHLRRNFGVEKNTHQYIELYHEKI